jgi:hypothetical protein
MDSHFSSMLDIRGGGALTPYIPASSFQGAKAGYYFGKSSRGVGYYVDAKQGGISADDPETIVPSSVSMKKRKFEEALEHEEDGLDENNPQDIDDYITNAELNNQVEALTADSLQQVYYFV